jgi:adenosylhomocysteine nucleosidase
MSRDPVIGLVMATMLEAMPFLIDLKLEEGAAGPFPVYGKDRLRVIISGVGKANAAMACSYFICRYDPCVLCNLGAAGATDSRLELGECRQIERIIEPDRPDLDTGLPHEQAPAVLEGIPSVTLATQDKPVRKTAEREKIARLAQLVDMEGAAVSQTCRRFDKPCYVFKFSSDTPVHGQISDIRANVFLYREEFYHFFRKDVLPELCKSIRKAQDL